MGRDGGYPSQPLAGREGGRSRLGLSLGRQSVGRADRSLHKTAVLGPSGAHPSSPPPSLLRARRSASKVFGGTINISSSSPSSNTPIVVTTESAHARAASLTVSSSARRRALSESIR